MSGKKQKSPPPVIRFSQKPSELLLLTKLSTRPLLPPADYFHVRLAVGLRLQRQQHRAYHWDPASGKSWVIGSGHDDSMDSMNDVKEAT